MPFVYPAERILRQHMAASAAGSEQLQATQESLFRLEGTESECWMAVCLVLAQLLLLPVLMVDRATAFCPV